jgi:hypothetical protein
MLLGMVVSLLFTAITFSNGLPLVLKFGYLYYCFGCSYQEMCWWCLICDQMRVYWKLALVVK